MSMKGFARLWRARLHGTKMNLLALGCITALDHPQFVFRKSLMVMQWKSWGVRGGVAVMVMAAMVGCAPVQQVAPVEDAATAVGTQSTSEASPVAEATTVTEEAAYDDPFAYCAAVGTIDAPDERYTGEELPVVILEGVRDALNANDVDLEVFEIGTVWRCMDGQVYACNVGANLPCLAKADESREPTEPMVDFCAESPDSDFIPAVVTGRSTVYNWACEDGEPVVVDQFTEVDSQGFLEFVWYALPAPE